MKIIKPTFEIIEQKEGLQGIYEQIELAGRTCYKSDPTYTYYKRHKNNNIVSKTPITEEEYIKLLEDPNTKDSVSKDSIKAKDFVDRMIKSGHGAMLEHGTVYLHICKNYWSHVQKYTNNKYSKLNFKLYGVSYNSDDNKETYDAYITTNLRVLVENNWLDDLKFLCEPTEYHEKRVTVVFTTDRITGESFLRHRSITEDHPLLETVVTKEMEKEINSFARQSTRYCNYSKDKFDSGINVIQPSFITDEEIEYNKANNNNNNNLINYCKVILDGTDENIFSKVDYWLFAILACEYSYNNLIRIGCIPQEARSVLNFSICSPLVMTAFISDWEHFFNLRALGTTGTPHPDARLLARPLMEEFNKRFKK